MGEHSYKEWYSRLLAEVESKVGAHEFASFLALLQALSQKAQDIRGAAEVVRQLASEGHVRFWGKDVPFSLEDLSQTSFDTPILVSALHDAMLTMHAKVGVHPRSLQFTTKEEKAFSAVAIAEGIKMEALTSDRKQRE